MLLVFLKVHLAGFKCVYQGLQNGAEPGASSDLDLPFGGSLYAMNTKEKDRLCRNRL